MNYLSPPVHSLSSLSLCPELFPTLPISLSIYPGSFKRKLSHHFLAIYCRYLYNSLLCYLSHFQPSFCQRSLTTSVTIPLPALLLPELTHNFCNYPTPNPPSTRAHSQLCTYPMHSQPSFCQSSLTTSVTIPLLTLLLPELTHNFCNYPTSNPPSVRAHSQLL